MARRGKDRRAPVEQLVTVEEAASFLGVQTGTVYLWAETGRVPSYKIGALRRFRISDLEDHLRAHRQGHDEQVLANPEGAGGWSVVDGIIPRSHQNDGGR
jgi:excisionase family DNA binding protein